MKTITAIAINNVTKGANYKVISSAIKYARNELDIKLTNNKVSAIEKKIKKLVDNKATKEDETIIAGLNAEVDSLKASIKGLEVANEGLEAEYKLVIDDIVNAGNSEAVAKNLLNYYASEGNKKYYAIAFEVDEDCLAQLRIALDTFWDKIISDGSRHEFTSKDLKEVKSKVAYILKNFFALNEDCGYFTKKPVKTNNELVRGLCDMYIQNVTSVLRKNKQGVKTYDGIKVKTLVVDSKKGTNYSKLLASMVDIYVIPQYTKKYVEKKSK